MIRKILIIEDDPGDQKLIKLGLARISKEFETTIISDGEKAVEFINEYDPVNEMVDLIILDLNLPRIGGMDVLARIVKNKLLLNIPVVILSTSGVEANQNSELLKYVRKYYRKPATIEKFFQLIEKMFYEDLKDFYTQED